MTSIAQDIAALIVKRHGERSRFQPMRARIGDDTSLAYDVQGLVNRELGGGAADAGHAAGYKIGLTTPRMQAMCGIAEPVCGTVFAGRLHASRATIATAPFVRLGVESEMAVQIGSVPDSSGLDAESVLASISQVCAAFELIDDGDADYSKLDAASLIADNAWNAGLVLGPPVPARDYVRLKDRAGVLYQNGEALDRGTSSDVLGDPLDVVVWLVQHLAARGTQLCAGQWISTGSIVTTKFVKPGESYRFELEGLHPVDVTIA